MKNSKTFVFDIDGVLADFILGFTTLAHQMYPSVAPYSTLQQKTWGQFGGLSAYQEAEVWKEVMVSPYFWSELESLATFSDYIRLGRLCEIATVYFVTNRAGVDPIYQTKNWLQSQVIVSPNIIVSKYKGECCRVVNATYAIDDKADNASCIAWNSMTTDGITIPYLIDRPYNQYNDLIIGSKHVRRVKTLNEYLESCLEACE